MEHDKEFIATTDNTWQVVSPLGTYLSRYSRVSPTVNEPERYRTMGWKVEHFPWRMIVNEY